MSNVAPLEGGGTDTVVSLYRTDSYYLSKYVSVNSPGFSRQRLAN